MNPVWSMCAGNNAALTELLAAEAPNLADSWRRSWDLDADSVTLDPAVAAGNPLLAAMLALHKESCRLLYASGAMLAARSCRRESSVIHQQTPEAACGNKMQSGRPLCICVLAPARARDSRMLRRVWAGQRDG